MRGNGQALSPGPRGRILFLGAFNGGVGGIERLTRTFAVWAESSGYTATMVFRHVLPPGPFSIRDSANVRVLPERAWSKALATTPWDLVYVMPAALKKKRWIPRVRALSGVKVGLELDHASPWLDVFDVLHSEAPREQAFAKRHVVATPDPRLTMPRVEGPPTSPGAAAGEPFVLSVFTPYGPEKGHDEIPAFLEGDARRLVWCHDLASFASRGRHWEPEIRARIDEVARARLWPVESPTQDEVYRLYAQASGYACFSRREGLGWALLDALALGVPICSRRVGICRALVDFEPTEDFARPRFGRYDLPPTPGFEGLFAEVTA